MSKHLWMQELSIAAYCPKCNAPDFKRSNTRSSIERLVRRFSPRVPYRCHKCSYRTLADQTKLRYPPISHKEFEEHDDFASKIEVPDVGINSISSQLKPKSPEIQKDFSFAAQAPLDELPTIASKHDEEIPEEVSAVERTTSESVSEEKLSSMFPKFDEQDVHEQYDAKIHGKGKHRHSARCPSCGEFALHRSHARTLLEGLRKKFNAKRIFRCHECDWRGWVHKSF